MARFCTRCGHELKEGARFCAFCGQGQAVPNTPPTPQPAPAKENTPAPRPATPNGFPQPTAPMTPDRFVRQCAPAKENTPAPHPAPAKENTAVPRSAPGEILLGSFSSAAGAASNVFPGLGKVLSGSFKRFASSFVSFFKNPKKLIFPLAVATAWLILDILQACGVDILPTRVLSFLTFAKGGLSGGFLGVIGGLVGKGAVIGAAASVGSLVTKKGQKAPFSDVFKHLFHVSLDSLGGFLTGAGVAAALYLFVSGGMMRAGFMAGLACAFLAAKAAVKRGFLQNLIGSVAAKGKSSLGPGASGLTAGLAAGFASSALLGLLKIKLIVIIPAALLITGGIVLMILSAKGILGKKEATNA